MQDEVRYSLRCSNEILFSYDNADTFVDWLVREDLLVREPVVGAALQGQRKDLSLSTIQRRFLRATGITRSAARQIERARSATLLLQQGVSILDTAPGHHSYNTGGSRRLAGFDDNGVPRRAHAGVKVPAGINFTRCKTEFLLLSLGESYEAIRAFAGDDLERAVYYSKDKEFLVPVREHMVVKAVQEINEDFPEG